MLPLALSQVDLSRHPESNCNVVVIVWFQKAPPVGVLSPGDDLAAKCVCADDAQTSELHDEREALADSGGAPRD